VTDAVSGENFQDGPLAGELLDGGPHLSVTEAFERAGISPLLENPAVVPVSVARWTIREIGVAGAPTSNVSVIGQTRSVLPIDVIGTRHEAKKAASSIAHDQIGASLRSAERLRCQVDLTAGRGYGLAGSVPAPSHPILRRLAREDHIRLAATFLPGCQ
jgi:hypothetical protein